jgi:hypothetical protein
MRIEDYDSVCDATNPADIEAALSKRCDGGINAFWLTHGDKEFPTIGILVKGSLANVHYIPRDRDAGFVSVADVSGPSPAETCVFFVRPTEKIWIRDDAVIPFSDALKVAHEFSISATIPKCIQWFKL